MCTTPEQALHPRNGTEFPKPLSCPVNGFGGSWYNEPFGPAPIYNYGAPGVVTNITWAAIDKWATGVSNVWVTTGTCFGLCLATLAFIVALTPNKKKGKPFHTSLLLALIFEMGRLLCDMGRASNVGLSPYSAYLGLTLDWTAVTYSSTFQGLDVTAAICATCAFFFTAICLYIQASGLLTGLRIKYQSFYVAIVSYLAFTSTFALVFRIMLTAYQSLYLTHKIEWNSVLFIKLQLITGVAYAVCLGSYCTISLASVCWLIYSRSHLIISNRPYDAALTILSLIFMESFIVPIIFLVLQAFPGVKFPLAELVVLPSVLVLLPMGSLFMTAHSREPVSSATPHNAVSHSTPSNAIPELESRPLGFHSQSSPVNESYNLHRFDTSSRAPLVSDVFDRELRAIDDMSSDKNESGLDRSDTETILNYRARKVRKTSEANNADIV